MLRIRQNGEAVSEIVGNLLILMITVALFGVVLGFIYSIPGPDAALQAEIVPVMERTSATDATVHLQHTGGEDLNEGSVFVIVTINDVPTRYEISDGLGGKKVMEPGDVWTRSFAGTVPTSAKVDVRIIDALNNNMLFYTVVQRGVASGGNNDPIIAYAWWDTTSGSDIIPNNDYTTFRIYAVCKDLDGNLPATGSVTASFTSTDNGDGTFSITAFGAGTTAMSDTKGDGVYLTGLLKVKNTVSPGDYIVTITATDDTARVATAVVKVTVSTSTSILKIEGEDIAPPLLKAGDVNKVFMKLKFTATGESIHLTQIRVTKLGTIPDGSCTVHCYWDKDGDGVLTIGTDYDLPGWGAFSGGLRDFIATPMFTAIEDTPTYVWVVLNIGAGTEGRSVGVRIASQASVISIGVSTPIKIPPIGTFPIDSSIRTVKGVFKVWGSNIHPTYVLVNSNDVRMVRISFQATGETVYIKNFNLTLFGTVARDQVQVYLRDEYGVILQGPTPFDLGTGRVELAPIAPYWKVDKAEAQYDIDVYFNILGAAGNTVGVRLQTVTDVMATTEISMDDINPQSTVGEPIPNPANTITLQSNGYVTHDLMTGTNIPVRAGDTNIFMRQMLFRCYGEPIRFYSFNFTLLGTVDYDEVLSIRLRVRRIYSGGTLFDYPNIAAANPWFDQTIPFNSARWARFQNAIPTNPMFTVGMDSNFYGYVYMDAYINLGHGIEGKTVQIGLEASTRIVSVGQITGTSITIVPYGGAVDNFPIRSDARTVNGQLYVHRTSLIPSPLVDSSQNIPVIKLTFKAEGQNVNVNQIVVRKLGIVAGNLVTVRIYRDVDNDTVNRLDGDDVELDAVNAGSFVSNAITFNPAFTVVMGVDYNVVVSFSLNLGTAGWTLGCSVNAGEVGTQTWAPNNQNAFPNACLNVTRNPPMGMTTPIVPINDRGKLTVYPEDLSPAFPHDDNTYAWMKLTFYAEGENVDVSRIVVRMDNLTGAAPPDWTQIRIMLVGDLNNNSVWNAGDDWLGSRWLDSSGEAAFLAFPLFVARQRTDYNLLIYVYFNWGVNGYVRMNISDEMSIQSKGQVSALSITPTTTFPIMSTERRVT